MSYGEEIIYSPSVRIPVYDDVEGQVRTLYVDAVDVEGRLVPSRMGLIGALGLSQSVEKDEVPQDLAFNCGLEIKYDMQMVTIGGQEIPTPLTKLEFAIFSLLASEPNSLHSRTEIRDRIWKESVTDLHTVDVHLVNIRRKLGITQNVDGTTKPGPNTDLIVTRRGRGFHIGARAFSDEPLTMPQV